MQISRSLPFQPAHGRRQRDARRPAGDSSHARSLRAKQEALAFRLDFDLLQPIQVADEIVPLNAGGLVNLLGPSRKISYQTGLLADGRHLMPQVESAISKGAMIDGGDLVSSHSKQILNRAVNG